MLPLDPEELCDPYSNMDMINMVLKDWQMTHSPLVYWRNQLDSTHYLKRYRTLGMSSDGYRSTRMIFGLPWEEGLEICKARFRQDFAKVTIEITDPKVMKIVKDIKISFYDQLGVFGK